MFPARNRIIAALSAITVVVQARSRSGALVTARHAAQLGRRSARCPGRSSSPLSAGPHALIRGGAELITGAQDVLDLLYGPGERTVADARRAQLAPTDAALLDALDEGHEGHAAFVRAGLGPVDGLEAIAALELAGLVRRSPGGRLTVTGPRRDRSCRVAAGTGAAARFAGRPGPATARDGAPAAVGAESRVRTRTRRAQRSCATPDASRRLARRRRH